jgi:hypothetical protein
MIRSFYVAKPLSCLTLFLFFCCSTLLLHAQSVPGSLKGQVTYRGDLGYGATITLFKDGDPVTGANTDGVGYYSIANIETGVYEVKACLSGECKTEQVSISSGTTAELNIDIGTGPDAQIDSIIIIDKLVEKDQVIRQDKKSLEDLRKLGGRGITDAIAVGGGGVYQADAGRGVNVRGGRGDQIQYFVDGMRVTGNASIPQISTKSINLISGGTPPWYGDVMSGVVEIESQDPQPKHQFGGELLTSQFLDANGYNMASISAAGPIWRKRMIIGSDTNTEIVSKLGYFFAFEGEFERDRFPAFGGVKRAKPGVMEQLENDPLIPQNRGGTLFFLNRSQFLRSSDFETRMMKEHNSARRLVFNLRMDYKLSQNAKIQFGANYRNGFARDWTITNSVFAPNAGQDNNTENIRAFVRFNQVIIPKDASNSIFKSLYYNLQADVTRVNSKTYNEDFGDDLFRYGHVGRFALNHNGSNELLPYRQVAAYRIVTPGSPEHDPNLTSDAYWVTAGFPDTSVTFQGSNNLDGYARYNNSIYNYYRQNPQFLEVPGTFDFFSRRQNVRDLNTLFLQGGMLNGLFPARELEPYSMFRLPGSEFLGYNKSRNDMLRVTGYAQIELGSKTKGVDEANEAELSRSSNKGGTHKIRVGFEFDQRQEAFYSIGASGLWFLARQLANRPLTGLDTANQTPVFLEQDGVRYFQDTVKLERLFDQGSSTPFAENIRRRLGLAPNSNQFINTDFYDPGFYSLDMFTASELQRGGNNSLISYYGYDYKGNISRSRNSLEDFFNDPINRPMNAFAPTYIAGYIQDKFELENIYFSLGVRIDRLDLNQPVLKDKYVMRQTWTADEAARNANFSLPSNIGGDWVPYVNRVPVNEGDFLGQDAILGYRSNDRWYDRNGAPVDPTLLQVNGEVIPYIRGRDELTSAAFEDYEPQINVLPRVSFSFSINDQANFFAHYDVLTQRPTGAENFQITDYAFIQQNATIAIANPNLRPARTVDYEVGFMQNLDKEGTLAITISAFYREMRDMIQFFRVQNAYPITYDTYENIDFGTVKGLILEFRTTPQKLVSFRTSYTLQFANGTGSDLNTARAATQGLVGFSTIRNLYPFTFDQRHTLTGNIALSFDDNLNRQKGPKVFGYYPLRNFSAAFTFRVGSGTPFSRNAIPNAADIQEGVNPTVRLQGNPNGSNLPFNYNFDLRLDRSFNVNLTGEKDADGKITKAGRELNLRFYVVCLNVFNIQNVLGVWRFSGQPDRTGFLESPAGQLAIRQAADPDAFQDQYRIKEQTPNNFSLPRRIRLGCIFSF